METDLISRKAVLDKFNRKSDMWNALTDEETSKEFWLFCRVADALDTIPSVPAVPIGQLCLWLEKTKKTPACAECRAAGIQCGEYGLCGSKEHWQALFPKILEEFHEHR